MSATLTIAKREFRSYFDSPVAYVVVCLSFLMLGFLFFFDILGGGFWSVDQASLKSMFAYAPAGLSLLVVPVITMRLMAEERRSGTLEMLITLPVKDSDVVLGKYLGALGLVMVLLLLTGFYPLLMFKWPWDLGAVDMNPVWSGYLGLFLFSAFSVSVGLLISSVTQSQIVAFFVTFITLGGSWVLGVLADAQGLPMGLRTVLAYVSTRSRLEGFFRGLIDTRDIVFFVSLTLVCLVISFRALERRKWA